MKKFYSDDAVAERPKMQAKPSGGPKSKTLAAIRQFARAFHPCPALPLGGVILN